MHDRVAVDKDTHLSWGWADLVVTISLLREPVLVATCTNYEHTTNAYAVAMTPCLALSRLRRSKGGMCCQATLGQFNSQINTWQKQLHSTLKQTHKQTTLAAFHHLTRWQHAALSAAPAGTC